ncbi:MAG: TrmH family RNA methyltransferase [Phycisphaerales bacterium]
MTRRPPHPPPSSLIVFGKRSVAEALAEPSVHIERILIAREAAPAIRKDIAAAARQRHIDPETIPGRELTTITAQPRHDQGVAARIRLSNITSVEAIAQSATGADAARPIRLLALDHVTNPQNVGMIVRSALAMGIAGLVWPTVGVPWINGLVVKAAAGTIYRCPIVRAEGPLEEALWALQARGFTIIGLDANASEDLPNHTPPHRAVYVLGAEAAGLSPAVAGTVDRTVRIPMAAGVESLNVAVAAALLCYAIARA